MEPRGKDKDPGEKVNLSIALCFLEREITAYEQKAHSYTQDEEKALAALCERFYLAGLKHARDLLVHPDYFVFFEKHL